MLLEIKVSAEPWINRLSHPVPSLLNQTFADICQCLLMTEYHIAIVHGSVTPTRDHHGAPTAT